MVGDVSGPVQDGILEWIAEIGNAIVGQHIGFGGWILDMLLRITAKQVVFARDSPIDLQVALVLVGDLPLRIDELVVTGIGQWIKGRIHNCVGGRAQSKTSPGQIVEWNCRTGAGSCSCAGLEKLKRRITAQSGAIKCRAGTGTQFSEISGPFCGAQNTGALGSWRHRLRPLVVNEEEKLIFDNRAAKSAAKLVVAEF